MADGSLAEQHDAGERALLDDLVGSHENRLRDRQADCFGGPEVYDKLELGGLLDRQVGRFGAFEDFAHVVGGTAEQIWNVRTVGYEPPDLYTFPLRCTWSGAGS
jgi:hypothetical protein